MGGRVAGFLILLLALAPAAGGLGLGDAGPSPLDPGQAPATASEVAPWIQDTLEFEDPATPEPVPGGPVADTLAGVEDPAWRAWLLELDRVRRTMAAAAGGDAPVEPGPAASAWGHAIERVPELVDQRPRTAGPSLDVCGVVRVDANGVDSTSTCDYLLELDLGGDDTYRNNAGGSLPPAAAGPGGSLAAPSALLVDVAGEDTYDCEVDRGGCTGGGHLGAGGLFDLGGDDTYAGSGRIVGVNGGGGDHGLGLLVDAAGSDHMDGHAGEGGINGGASFGGAGLLLDAGGNDGHHGNVTRFGGVNGAANDGLGVLVDLGGSDRRTGEVGIRGGVNAGGEQAAGLLLDAGDAPDLYDGTVYGGGVNGAGNGEPGLYRLVDEGGDDVYRGAIGWAGAVNGAGFSAGSGHLVDRGGDDRYDATITAPGAANGAGVGGLGHLEDHAGDDTYTAWILGAGAANGAAHHGGGVLADLSGDDVYEATILDDPDHPHPLWGSGTAKNGDATVGVGLLLDPDRSPGPAPPTGGMPG